MNLAAKVFRRDAGGDPNIVALLSLKLLLLAFFILLAAISQFEEERSRAVMESVTTTFEGIVPAPRADAPVDSALGALDGAPPTLSEQVEQLFEATLPAVEMDTSADGTVLRIEAPASSLFVVNSASLAPGRGVLMHRLVDALSGDDGALRFFDLQFLHTIPDSARLEADSLPVLRTGVVVRSLEEQGLDRGDLATGLRPVPDREAETPSVIFEIRLHPEAIDAGTVDEAGAAP